MPKMNPEKKSISVVLSAEAKAALEELAIEQSTDDEKKNASDVVRQAIAQYLNGKGRKVSIDVERGGYRERRPIAS